MRIDSIEIESLPRLAWCARLDKHSDQARLLHGPWVEVHGNTFFEGAWSGDLGDGDIHTGFFAGSGGKATDDHVLFVTPNHTLDALYVVKDESTVRISNSLAFLLAQTNDSVDTDYLFYDQDLASTREGLEKYARSIPTASGRSVLFFNHCNIQIGSDLELVERPKPDVPDFSDYSSYYTFLEDTVKAVCTNAQDHSRRIRYQPMATISSGYDSPACAVLARQAGCREAISFLTQEDQDTGSRIAKLLNMEIKVVERLQFTAFDGCRECEFRGGPSAYLSWDASLEKRVLFTGFHGDTVWDRNCTHVSRDIVRGDGSGGSGWTEFRLRVGFVHLPVPFIGCTSHPSIQEITQSEEMRPWVLGNEYDRPVARRMVEEAGIPRELFGMEKMAVGGLTLEFGLKKSMSNEGFLDFTRFCRDHWGSRKALKATGCKVLCRCVRIGEITRKAVATLTLGRIKLPSCLPPALRRLTSGYAGRSLLYFHWGQSRLKARYEVDRSSLKEE